MNSIPIVFAIDQNVEMPAGVAISSLLSNADMDTFYDIFILHSAKFNFAQSRIHQLQKLFPNCRITFRSVKVDFDGAFEIRGITETCYYRMLIPEIIPEYPKILYSDVDVIFRDDLSQYYNEDIEGYYLGGVDIVPSMDRFFLNHITKIGIVPEMGYFNSGSLVFNSKLLLEDNKLSEFRRHGKFKYQFQDQDIINLTCSGRIKALPVGFNLTTSLYQVILDERKQINQFYYEKDLEEALCCGTIHYAGAKPWKDVCLNMDIWWDYYRKSIFFDERFVHDFWFAQTYRMEKMSLWKRIKLVGRFFREGGKK